MRVVVAIPETRETKALVMLACTYEVAAIGSNRLPTITALHRRWPILGAAIVAALTIHFFTPDPTLKES